MRMHVVFFIATLGACGGGGGGGDDGGVDAGVSPKCMEAESHSDLAWIQTNIFSSSCTFSSCHGGTGSQANNLSLDAGNSHGELVNQHAVEDPGMMLVVPGQSGQSYLMVAIGAVPGQLPMDGQMPLNSPGLCAQKQDAIARWIDAGATE